MKLSKIYLETISHFGKDLQEAILLELPHTRFSSPPPELKFLGSPAIVDLGFEDLKLSSEEKKEVYVAFAGHGVRIPKTQYRIRSWAPMAIVELAADELSLPDDWLSAVVVLGVEDKLTWLGDKVRDDRKANYSIEHLTIETPLGLCVPEIENLVRNLI